MSKTIVGIGEALWDCFPDGRRLPGGAPFNFAVQADRLIRPFGGRAVPVTRIGDDAEGRELLAALPVTHDAIEVDPVHPTGRVEVTLVGGEPCYEIARDAAWDFIECPQFPCDAVCWGTLAQRSPISRSNIDRFVANTPDSTLRLFDINLRQQFWDRGVIERGLELATAVKLNRDEMEIVAEMFGLADPRGLLHRFHLKTVVLTRGAQGTMILTSDNEVSGDPVSFPSEEDADPVGAGDACAAAVTVGLVLGWPLERIVRAANQIGAWVASRKGALPPLPNHTF